MPLLTCTEGGQRTRRARERQHVHQAEEQVRCHAGEHAPEEAGGGGVAVAAVAGAAAWTPASALGVPAIVVLGEDGGELSFVDAERRGPDALRKWDLGSGVF